MFKFLKKKLKDAVKSFSKKAEEEVCEEPVSDNRIIKEVIAEENKNKIIEERSEVEDIPDTPEAEEFRSEKSESPKKKSIKKRTKEKRKTEEENFKAKYQPKEDLLKKEANTDQEKKKSSELCEEHLIGVSQNDNKKTIIKKEKKGLFSVVKDKFTKKQLTKEKFEELFWGLELTLLENNVAMEVIEKIKKDLEEELTTGKVSRKGIDAIITDALKRSIEELFVEPFNLIEKIKKGKKPYVILFLGINGSGKTTTLAKVANMAQEEGLSVVIAAADTFRAAAIDQLEEHAKKLSIKIISQGYGADPAAVAYDAIKHAKSKGVDLVLIDTAGRLHSNKNLMSELEKLVRVSKPDMKLFVGEAITGNDCVEQAKEFDTAVGIDAIILTKADVDEKGGAAISISYVTKKPIIYLGTGQTYGDLKPFNKVEIIRNLDL